MREVRVRGVQGHCKELDEVPDSDCKNAYNFQLIHFILMPIIIPVLGALNVWQSRQQLIWTGLHINFDEGTEVKPVLNNRF